MQSVPHGAPESTAPPVSIVQADLFSIPMFQVAVPEMAPYRETLMTLFGDQVRNGTLKPHANGYGYQTKMDLFDPEAYPYPWLREVLMVAFHRACRRILSGTVTDFAPGTPHEWVNTFNAGWATIQTGKTWPEEIPWHTHLPAVLSGCYYVSTAKRRGEGLLQFMNPNTPNMFQPKIGEIEPKAGQMLIFPSHISHRPTAAPGNGDTPRIALCMDGHWTSRIGHPGRQSSLAEAS